MNNEYIISGVILGAIALGLILIPVFAGTDIYFLNNGSTTSSGNDTTVCGNGGTDTSTSRILCAGDNVLIKSLLESTGIQLDSNSTHVAIQNSLPESTTCGNLGSISPLSEPICADQNIALKRALEGVGILLSGNATHFTITNSLPESTVCNNLGSSSSLSEGICNDSNVDLKRLLEGTGILLSSNSTHVTITNNYVCQGAGGTNWIKASDVGLSCTIKGVTVTTPIVLTSNTNDLNLSCPTCITNSSSTVSFELCRDTASSGDTSLSCTLTSKKFIRVEALIMTQTGGYQSSMRFNSDGGANYATRYSANNAADTLQTNASASDLCAQVSLGFPVRITIEIFNISTIDKVGWFSLGVAGATDDATASQRCEGSFLWNNSSSGITNINLLRNAGTGTLTADSLLVVYGHD